MRPTARQAVHDGRRTLASSDSLVRDETPELDAEVLLRYVLGMSRAGLYTDQARPLTSGEARDYAALLARRRRGEPVAYLTGRREFMGLDFAVDARVLVPRPETEVLVQRALDRLAEMGDGVRAADVGTGSGAVAVSLAAHRPGRRVYATDVSAAALELARDNARRLLGPHQARVAFIRGPLLNGIEPPLHLVAANLPYVPSAEIETLALPVRRYEPRLALDGGADGLDHYRALLPQAATRLAPGGTLLMECDPRQSAPLRRLAEAAFPGAAVTVLQDLAGLDRVVEVRALSPEGTGRG